MPRIISPEVRLEAMGLYVTGDLSAKQITEKISDKFGINITLSTVYAWSKKFNWDEKRLEIQSAGTSAIMETESQRFARLNTDHLNIYGKLRVKAEDDLEGLEFHDAGTAARTIDMSIQGERETMKGLINIQFVQDILNVLVEEITDEKLIGRIASRFQGIIQQAGSKN
jgi:transposase